MRSTRIVVEVVLHERAVLDVQLFQRCHGQAPHHRAFELRQRVLRLHGQARVGGHPVVVHLHLAAVAVQGDLGDAQAEMLP